MDKRKQRKRPNPMQIGESYRNITARVEILALDLRLNAVLKVGMQTRITLDRREARDLVEFLLHFIEYDAQMASAGELDNAANLLPNFVAVVQSPLERSWVHRCSSVCGGQRCEGPEGHYSQAEPDWHHHRNIRWVSQTEDRPEGEG